MGTNKGSRKLSSSSPEGAVRFRHQSTDGADPVASLSFHRHRPLAKKKRIKSNGKKYNINKATTYGWISYSTILFTLVCGGFFSLFHIFIGQRDANGMKKKGVRSHNGIINKDPGKNYRIGDAPSYVEFDLRGGSDGVDVTIAVDYFLKNCRGNTVKKDSPKDSPLRDRIEFLKDPECAKVAEHPVILDAARKVMGIGQDSPVYLFGVKHLKKRGVSSHIMY